MKDKHKSAYAKSNAKTKAKAVAHSLTKNQKLEVKKLALGKIETKYCSDININLKNQIIANNIPLTNFYACIPAIGQGDGQNQRSGNVVSDAVVRVQLEFWLRNLSTFTNLWRVKIFVLESKRIKAVSNMYDATGVQLGNTGPLLNNGDGNMVNWLTSTLGEDNQQYDKMPVNTDDYTVLHTKSFDLTKNVGSSNGGLSLIGSLPGDPVQVIAQNPNLGKSTKKVNFKIKIKKLLYDNTTINTIGGAYPTNHNIFLFIVAWDPTYTITPSPTNSTPLFSVRNDIYFKDG